MIAVLILILGLVSSTDAGKLTYTDCNTGPMKAIDVQYVYLSPDPILIANESETAFVHFKILRPIEGHHFKLSVTVQKKILFGYVKIPCVNNSGSCDYDDLCQLLSEAHYDDQHRCPLGQHSSPSHQGNCTCPFKPGDYYFNKTKFQISDKLQGPFKILGTYFRPGDYHVHVTLTDTSSGWEVGCYDMHISVTNPCQDISCIFG